MCRPAEMTEQEQLGAIKWLAKLPMKELRKRQRLIASQVEIATGKHNDLALANLGVMAEGVRRAIDKQAFGEEF